MNTTPAPSRRRWLAAGIGVLTGGATIAAAFAAGTTTIKGNGVLRTQDRPASGFHGIGLALPAEVELRIGASEGITIETDENLLSHIESVVEGGVLQLRTREKNASLQPRTLRIVVNAREIRHLAIAGGGRIRAASLKAPKLELEVAGAGVIDVQQLDSDKVSAEIGGSGDITLAGAARRLSVEIAGSGDVQAPQLKAGEVSVSIAGSGSATLWPVDGLRVSIAGSGDVRYYGDPKTRTSVAGSGGIRRMGPAPR